MSHWNYRIVKHKDTFALHEVFYGDDGEPMSMTDEPIDFSCDHDEGPDGIVSSLEMALADAKSKPVFVAPEEWTK